MTMELWKKDFSTRKKNVHDLKNARRKVAIHFVQKVGIGKVKLHFDFF